LSGLAVDADGGRSLVHLGVSGGYQEAPGGQLKSKSVPEVYEAPDFVDTGTFPADHATSFGAELAATRGPFSISAEYTGLQIDSPSTLDPYLLAFYVMGTWSLTGETRPYLRSSGVFGRIEPAAPFSFKHGGLGAWEVAARYSRVDLTSGTLDGGVFDRWSGALSWFPTYNFRFEFNYGYGRLRKAGLDGRTHFYQLRLQLEI
jgi:phosphate-selective porin OprO/OprP